MLAPFAAATHTTPGGLEDEGCAVTKGGWGAPPNGHNPGALLHQWFDTVFGNNLTVGDLVFDDAQDVTDFLPNGGFSNIEEQAVALAINIAFGDAGLLNGTITGVLSSSSNSTLDNKTPQQILAIAEQIILNDSTPTAMEYPGLIEVMTGFNEETFGCAEERPPPCPTNVMAVPGSSGNIVVSWNAVTNASQYNVYRSLNNSTTFILLTMTTNLSHNDTTTAPGSFYTYVVTALVDGRESEDCPGASAVAIPYFPGLIAGVLAAVGAVAAMQVARRRRG